MSAQVILSQSANSSPREAGTPYETTLLPAPRLISGQEPQSLSRRNSSKMVPSFIITDTSPFPNNDNKLNAQQQITPLQSPNSKEPTSASPRLDSTFFNIRRGAVNDYNLPSNVVSKSLSDLDPSFLTNINTIVIDVRPYASYLRARLLNSLTICVPTTLLKRRSFAFKNIVGSMQKSQQDYINYKLETNERLDFLLYDDTSSCSHCSLHLYQTCLKVLDFAQSQDKPCTVNVLENGMSTVDGLSSILDSTEVPILSPLSPAFTESINSNGSPSSNKLTSVTASPATSNFQLAAFSGFSLPSADEFSSTFAASIKKCRPTSGSASNIVCSNCESSVHMPENCKLKAEDVPKWLQFYFSPVEAYKTIQRRFSRIEDIETLRLESVAKSNTKKSSCCSGSYCCSSDVCSPSAPCANCDQIKYLLPQGIEFGDKNRYSNIWPYEHSRVKIVHSPLITTPSQDFLKKGESLENDYFNANYISVPGISDNKYIATQAPLPSTLEDFWRAVWYNNVEIILCLTNTEEDGLKKSDKYWDSHVYGSGIEVKFLSETVDKEANIVIRSLQMQKTSSQTNVSQMKIVKQIEFKEWPDFGVPPTAHSIIRLIEIKESYVNDRKAPVVVHCSAGCGRTGTFITIDVLLQMYSCTALHKTPLGQKLGACLSPFGQFDRQLLLLRSETLGKEHSFESFKFCGDEDLIYKTVNILRRQRLSMVQTLRQYLMCYETIILAIDENQSQSNTIASSTDA